MSFIELIGFLVSLFFVFFLMVKKSIDDRRRRRNPDEYEHEEMQKAERLRNFLKGIDIDMNEREPPQPRKVTPAPQTTKKGTAGNQRLPSYKAQGLSQSLASSVEKVESKVERQKLKSSIENHRGSGIGSYLEAGHHRREKDAYSLVKSTYSNRAIKTLSSLKSTKDMVILHEIISPPVGLRR
jgi:hypothetical protein